jgi:DNA-binding PadR family transcriptional regulator
MDTPLDEFRSTVESDLDEPLIEPGEKPEFPSDPDLAFDEMFRRHADTVLDEKHVLDIDNEITLAQLDELLVLLIAVRNGGCGKVLRKDMRRLFGSDLSPGTVYPHLNDLAEEGVLEVKELPKRKIFRISDEETAFRAVESAMNQLLTVSFVLKSLMADWNPDHPDTHRGEHDGT